MSGKPSVLEERELFKQLIARQGWLILETGAPMGQWGQSRSSPW